MTVHIEDPDRSWEYFEAARQHMTTHGHPPRPEIYEVWYAYAARQDSGLVEKIDQALIGAAILPVKFIEDLHLHFLADEGDLVRTTSDKVAAELIRTLKLLESAGRDTSSFAAALDRIASKLKPEGDLRKIVDTIILATRHMEAKARRLEGELERSSTEIRALRQGLEAFKREAMTDPLTGLFNRRAFEERLRQAAAQAMETDTEMCLMWSDIDNFKALNDAWGHQVGDAVIQLVSTCIKDSLRPGDTAARMGGDEFAAVVPGLSLNEAHALAESIREQVSRKHLRDSATGKPIGHLSLSIGIAAYVLAERLDDLVHRADQAMFDAKNSGRNQVKLEAPRE